MGGPGDDGTKSDVALGTSRAEQCCHPELVRHRRQCCDMAMGKRPLDLEVLARDDVVLSGRDSRINWIVAAGRCERLASV